MEQTKNNKWLWLIIVVILAALAVLTYFVTNKPNNSNQQTSNTNQSPANINNAVVNATVENKNTNTVAINSQPATNQPSTNQPTTTSKLLESTDGFLQRITLKPFGIYITPATSPVQPERFTGYHTGADAEYTDMQGKLVEVKAIAVGTVVLSRRVSGYGGVVVIKHDINSQQILTLYGHLDPSSLVAINTQVTAGQMIGKLGEGYTAATDYERKHLHLAMLKGKTVDLRGYVSTEKELQSGWYNPLDFYK
jgi:murein DD-endopeptidase MepM/ murein hydrolase activator NlpD